MATRRAPPKPKVTPFWELPGYKFCTAEMAAWVGGVVIAAEWAKPQRGKPKSPEAEARLKAGRAKGKTVNKALRDSLDKAKEKAK